MPDIQASILIAVTYLAIKHTIADFFLQTPYQYSNKGKYGHPGGLLHAAIHGLLTLPVFFILAPSSPALAALIIALEFAIHYHVDWIKENFVADRGITSDAPAFWNAIGLDQLAHYLTYIGIVALLLSY